MKAKLILLAIAVIALSGCTRSIATKYEEGLTLSSNTLQGKSFNVEAFEDKRAWIDPSDSKSLSFIAQQGTWRFGIDYAGTEYFPVNNMLQDIIIRELNAAGANAAVAGESDADYTVSGQIQKFEFENEAGFVTVTSRRHISIAVTVTDNQGNQLLSNELFNELDRENEGMGVLHTTNVDKLLGPVLKNILTQVLDKMSTELAYMGADNVRLLVNGVDVTEQIHFHIAAR